MFRTLQVEKWWTDSDVLIEWWNRDGNSIKIIRDTIPFREYMDLAYLYREVKINDIQKFMDE